MLPAISQVCSLHSSFQQDLEDYKSGACGAVEIWLTKLEDYLKEHSIAEAKELLESLELVAPVASYQGGLLHTQGDARQQQWDHFAKRLDLCHQLGVGTIVVAGDMLGPLSEVDLERIQVSLAQAAREAAHFEVRVAFEFQAKATFCNNLETAAALVGHLNEPNLGLCLDLFHYYTGPSKSEDWGLLTPENLFHVQLCDVAGQPREFASDSDRILPGDGDFLIEPLIEHLRQIGYPGYVSLELMNPVLWQVPAKQIGEVGTTAMRLILGQASME